LSHIRLRQGVVCASRGFVSQLPDPVQKFRVKSDWSSEQLLWQTVVDG